MFDDPDEALDMWMSLNENVINKRLPWRERHVKLEKQPEWWCEEINDATNIGDTTILLLLILVKQTVDNFSSMLRSLTLSNLLLLHLSYNLIMTLY